MASPSLKNVNRAMKDTHKTNSIVRYSSLRSETNIWPGAWVIKRGSGAEVAASWDVTPQAQNTAVSYIGNYKRKIILVSAQNNH